MASKHQLALNFDGPLALMTVDEIYQNATVELIRSLFEDRRVERKRAGIHAEPLGEYFSMWGNTAPDGGVLVIGMEDGPEGIVSGCASLSVQQLNRLESARIDFCPDSRAESKRIEAINADGIDDYLLVIRVFYRSDKVVRTVGGQAFWRIADKKQKTQRRGNSRTADRQRRG